MDPNLPTILDRKVYVVSMELGIPLHKLDAGEVLPMAHGLLEERLVGAAKNAIDLVGDNTIVPGAFLTHGYSSPVAVLVGLTSG